jgi:hypothetical protein
VNCYFCHRPVGFPRVEMYRPYISNGSNCSVNDPAHLECLEAARACFIEPDELRALKGYTNTCQTNPAPSP